MVPSGSQDCTTGEKIGELSLRALSRALVGRLPKRVANSFRVPTVPTIDVETSIQRSSTFLKVMQYQRVKIRNDGVVGSSPSSGTTLFHKSGYPPTFV